MRRQGQYGDSSMDSYAAQMQQMSGQRGHHASGMNHFSGRPDSLSGEKENPYISSKAEAHWQLDKEGAKGPNPVSFYDNEGDGREASRSFYPGQRPDSKAGFNKQPNKDPVAQSHEQDMDVGYGDNALTFESLTQKFHDEIMKLTKEQQEAEDTENARHREKLSEINFKYHGKLTALRAQHASRRDDFLQREQQARQTQYQQAGMSHYQNSAGPSDPRVYGGAAPSAEAIAAAEAMAAAEAVNARGQLDLYRERERERAQYIGSDRNHGFESRGPYPGGRSYNTNARYY